MKSQEKSNSTHLVIIYIIALVALILSALSLTGILGKDTTNTDIEWRCNFAECTDYLEITGEEWAQENCAITEEGTICLVTLEDGQQFTLPLEEINLSAITATKCTNYMCTEELAYRKSNYTLEITNE